MSKVSEAAAVKLTTTLALDAVAYQRAPTQNPDGERPNRWIRCADGFEVSVQASRYNYANDSHPDGGAPYWRRDEGVVYPYITFEVGYPSDEPEPAAVWDEFEGGGIWAWVPRQVVADLLDLHGGAVAWAEPA